MTKLLNTVFTMIANAYGWLPFAEIWANGNFLLPLLPKPNELEYYFIVHVVPELLYGRLLGVLLSVLLNCQISEQIKTQQVNCTEIPW